MTRQARRAPRRRIHAALGWIGGTAVAVFLAGLVTPFASVWADPDLRFPVYVLALLAAYASGFLVVGHRRRRT